MGKEIVSLFSGAGGLDIGFKKAGFDVIYANEYDKKIWGTFEFNFKDIALDKRDIRNISSSEIPDCIGIIGGPPCQSWSEAGNLGGIHDPRGKLFYEYIRIIKDKKPLFFVAENVSGILHSRNKEIFCNIVNMFEDIGYSVKYKLLNSNDYGVPQDRERVFIVGFLNNTEFVFPQPDNVKPILIDNILDLQDKSKEYDVNDIDEFSHEYYTGGFSSIFMSRNRVRGWDEPSFTIQAGCRHIPIHPSAPKMEFVKKDKFEFKKGYEHLYRRFTVRECARIQTFPDSFRFIYNNIIDGYKMVGNAVPVNMGYRIAKKVYEYL